MLNEIIERIYESGEYAGIYANADDTSKFMYGKIVAFDGGVLRRVACVTGRNVRRHNGAGRGERHPDRA